MALANYSMHLKEMYNTFMENFEKKKTTTDSLTDSLTVKGA